MSDSNSHRDRASSLLGLMALTTLPLLGMASDAAAQCEVYADGLQWIGNETVTSLSGPVYFEIHDEMLYGNALDGTVRTFIVTDLSDPDNPVPLGELALAGTTFETTIDYAADHVYFAFNNKFGIVDVTDPSSPAQVAEIFSPTVSKDVEVGLPYAYFASDGVTGGVQIYDVTDPSNPVHVADSPALAAQQLALTETYLYYTANSSLHLGVLDVTNPASPAVAWDEVGEPFTALAIDGDLLLVGVRDFGVRVYDISVRTAPVLIGSLETPFFPSRIKVLGGTAYMECIAHDGYGDALAVLDYSDPTAPQIIGVAEDDVIAFDLMGDEIWTSDGTAVLSRFGGTEPANAQPLGPPVTLTRPIVALDVSGDHAYLGTDSFSGFTIVDVSDPANPTMVGSYDSGRVIDIEVQGSLAYVSDDDGLFIIDVTDPSSPTELGSIDDDSPRLHTVVEGSLAYVATAAGGFEIVDVSDPQNPSVLGFDFLSVQDVAVEGDRLAGIGNQLVVYDISDPANPTQTGSTSFSGTGSNIVWEGTTAYATGSVFLHTFDLSDPDTPVWQGRTRLLDVGSRMVLADERLYIATTNGGVHVFDLADPLAPTPLGFVHLGASSIDVDLSEDGDALFTVSPDLGLFAFAPDCGPTTSAPGEPSGNADAFDAHFLSVMPNPTSGLTNIQWEASTPEWVRVGIFDAKGRQVWADTRWFSGGHSALQWDGRDQSGIALPSGVYHVRRKGTQSEAVTRIHLVR